LHYCLGAPLAWLDGELAYKPTITLRGLSTLPVTVWSDSRSRAIADSVAGWPMPATSSFSEAVGVK
jgi:hypothetical protein